MKNKALKKPHYLLSILCSKASQIVKNGSTHYVLVLMSSNSHLHLGKTKIWREHN